MNARSTGLRRSMRARHSSTSSTGETRFARTASASAAAVSSIVKARQPYPARRGLSTRRVVSRALTARGADGAIPGLMAEPALDLLIKNVRVVRPTRPEVERGDIGVRDGRIARVAPAIAAGHVDEMEALATTHGVPSFKIFMFYGGYGLHGTAGDEEQRRFLMIGPEDHYDLAHFEFVMRAAALIRARHPRLAEHVSVSLHCEMADILNAYTRLVQKDTSLTGLAAYSAARPPHAEGLAVAVAAYLAHETACVNVNLLHLSSRKAVESALTMARAFPNVSFRREVTVGHLLLDPDRAFTVSAADSPSGQGYTPFEGQRLTGQVTATFLRGELSWEDGRAVGPPRGRYLRRPTPTT